MEISNQAARQLLSEQASHTVAAMRRVLAERFDINEPLNFDQPLDSLGLDSLSFVEYMFEVEKELKITLPDIPRELATLGELVSFVDAELKKQARTSSAA